MTENFRDKILIFCDGACSGNPGPGGWGSIIVTPEGNVLELGGSESSTTNNKMEMTAAIEALQEIRGMTQGVIICTDSTYLIRGITQWIFGWRKNGWKTAEGNEVSNQELWKVLSKLVSERGKVGKIEWKYVRGHTGVPGNERCDEIAVKFGEGKYVPLFNGPLIKYSYAIYDIPENTELPEMRPKQGPAAKPFSYLSLVGGIPARHQNWAQCESRVKGQSGAKFKKAMSPEEELEILKSWNVDPARLK